MEMSNIVDNSGLAIADFVKFFVYNIQLCRGHVAAMSLNLAVHTVIGGADHSAAHMSLDQPLRLAEWMVFIGHCSSMPPSAG